MVAEERGEVSARVTSAGQDGVDAVGAVRALGSRQDVRERCGSGVHEQQSAGQQRRWGRAWTRRRADLGSGRVAARDVGGRQWGSAGLRLATAGHGQAKRTRPA
jgi:hypothetical protein